MALDRQKYMKDVEMKEVFPTLNHAQQVYVKRIERENYERALAVKKMRRRNFRTGIGLGIFVISSYFYTMYSIRQEKLEEFDDEPEPAAAS